MGSWNPYSIWGLALLIVGIILVMIGIIIYEIAIRDRKKQSAWTYVMLIGGAVIVGVGGILLGVGLVKGMHTQSTTVYYRSPTSSTEFRSVYVPTSSGSETGYRSVYIPPGGYTTITGDIPPVIIPEL